MDIYKKLLEHLKNETSSGKTTIDLTDFFKNSGLDYAEFNDILKELQEEKLLTFESDITTTGLQPFSIVKGYFGNIKSMNLGEQFVFMFSAKLTFKGINYTID